MLDSDLADLYGVTTGNFNKAVLRNLDRFPSDFSFELTKNEFELITQNHSHGGRRTMPRVFTECGIAMLSGVLNSERAVQVNISIMRTYVKLRHLIGTDEHLASKLSKLERGTNHLFKIVFERLDSLEAEIPILPTKRKRIGLKDKD